MCGINGIFAYHYAANPIDRRELARTRDHMAARGPEGKGEWISGDERVGFGHRRLSIIDLSDAGAQPMSNADGSLIVTFNGEIYNHRELRRGLEAKGYVFRSNSDTEVLLHLYAEKGAAMVHDLRGMFAFAIWDEAERRLFLARDPYGIKPLYYADDGWTFRFASLVKSLIAGGAIAGDPDCGAQVGFFLWGSVPEPFTSYRHVQALPAGSTLSVDRIGSRVPRQYHSIASVYVAAERGDQRGADEHRAFEEARAALLDSVRSHLIADVPVGAFLSAGIDSGALVGLMRDCGAEHLQTVTIAFDEFAGRPEDEAYLAEEVAAHYGTQHVTRRVSEAEFQADLPRIMEAMDQPSIDGINTWFVSKAAHELGLKVAVSGLGGDELLGGYPSFMSIPARVGRLRALGVIPGLGRALRTATAPLARRSGLHPKAAGMLELGGSFAGAYLLQRGLYLPWELDAVLDPKVIADGLERLAPLPHIMQAMEPCPRSGFARVAALESTLYMRNQLLRDTDWASMAHSLEVRVPLVDSVLLERMAPLKWSAEGRAGKRMLARAPSRPLPDAVTNRAKTGFTTPINRWLQAAHAGKRGEPAAGANQSLPWAREWSRLVGQYQCGFA